MTGMYRGTKLFDREQLVFMVEAALAAAFDKVEGALPTGSKIVGGADLKDWLKNKDERLQFIWGAVHHVGIFVPILWAQTEGQRISDGMGTCDFVGWTEFEEMVEAYIQHNTVEGNEVTLHPDCRELAEKIVDNAWGEYLNGDADDDDDDDDQQEYTVRWSAIFQTKIRTGEKPGTPEFSDLVSDINIPEEDGTDYQDNSFEVISVSDADDNEVDHD